MILVDVPTSLPLGVTVSSYIDGYTVKSNLVTGVVTPLTATQYGTYLGMVAPAGAYYWYKKN